VPVIVGEIVGRAAVGRSVVGVPVVGEAEGEPGLTVGFAVVGLLVGGRDGCGEGDLVGLVEGRVADVGRADGFSEGLSVALPG
jgi:hypothetical protein